MSIQDLCYYLLASTRHTTKEGLKMDELNPKAKAERQLALMYAKLSSAHRCLAIAQEDDSQWSKMHDLAEDYFDEAEALGREALEVNDMYVSRMTKREVIELLEKAITSISDKQDEMMRNQKDHAYNFLKASGLSISIGILAHMRDELAGRGDNA